MDRIRFKADFPDAPQPPQIPFLSDQWAVDTVTRYRKDWEAMRKLTPPQNDHG